MRFSLISFIFFPPLLAENFKAFRIVVGIGEVCDFQFAVGEVGLYCLKAVASLILAVELLVELETADDVLHFCNLLFFSLSVIIIALTGGFVNTFFAIFGNFFQIFLANVL